MLLEDHLRQIKAEGIGGPHGDSIHRAFSVEVSTDGLRALSNNRPISPDSLRVAGQSQRRPPPWPP